MRERLSGDTKLSVEAEIVEYVPVQIAGLLIDTMHVRHTTIFSGAQRGQAIADIWYAVGDARIIKNSATVAVDADGPFGTVEYRSSFELLLTHPAPRT
jgi:hypothetical protein